jgi:hypothetical protein
MQRAASAASLGPRPGGTQPPGVAASSQSFTAGGGWQRQRQPGTALQSLAGDPLEWHRPGRGAHA